MRNSAGVTHLTVFTKPAPCGGACLYCPTVPRLPKSYLPHADIGHWNLPHEAREQVEYWAKQMRESGRPVEKVEVIVLGGSFAAHDEDYSTRFLSGIYEGFDGRVENVDPMTSHAAGGGSRVIGITIEARPDQVTEAWVRRLFRSGVTKIEMGVQILDDEVLRTNERGHNISEIARATSTIRDCGLKVGYHFLFGMPGSSIERDLVSLGLAFENGRFKPDHVKYYFCEMFRREFMQVRLVKMFDAGEWRPYAAADRLALMEHAIRLTPFHVRISRIGRKVRAEELEAGTSPPGSNYEQRFDCRCIRCREPRAETENESGAAEVVRSDPGENEIYLEVRPRGTEICSGILRMRRAGTTATVRELHVYGLESAVGRPGAHQHRGVGRMLMAEAERIACEFGCRSLRVASGVGVRRYYERIGYVLDDSSFMTKQLP